MIKLKRKIYSGSLKTNFNLAIQLFSFRIIIAFVINATIKHHTSYIYDYSEIVFSSLNNIFMVTWSSWKLQFSSPQNESIIHFTFAINNFIQQISKEKKIILHTNFYLTFYFLNYIEKNSINKVSSNNNKISKII